ncbi:MAG: type V CRISPR-associated endonuclease Cas1, partial [Candidatus Marinamargulisbacteria bacterium]
MLTFPDFKQKQLVIIFGAEGQRLKIKNDNLIVMNKDNEVERQLTGYKVLAVWILGPTSMTSGLMERSKKFGFPIILMSNTFKPLGVWGAGSDGNTLLKSIQYAYDSLDIARHLIKNKLMNQHGLLKTIRKKPSTVKDALKTIQHKIDTVDASETLSELMGTEGYCAKIFFKEWFGSMDWTGRKPRVKHDPTNVLLDMGYTFLFNFVEGLLLLYGFDPYKGVCHQMFYQRKSLVCDLVEPFRCIIDHKVLVAHGLKQIKTDDFEYINDQYRLSFKHAKPYTQFLVEAILERKDDIFLYI